MAGQEELVMTAAKVGNETTVRVERINKHQVNFSNAHFIATGPYKGIIVNKAAKGALPKVEKPHRKMEFVASLAKRKNKSAPMERESRELRFWFKPRADGSTKVTNTKEYFKALLQPEGFPKDYVYFIKKAVVLCQRYPLIKRMELCIKPVKDIEVVDYGYGVETVEKITATRTHTAYESVRSRVTETLPEEETEEELDDYDDDDPPIQNFITVLTPHKYDYQYLPEVPVSKKRFISFRVSAKADAHVALCAIYGDTERKTYEIALGVENNTKSEIRVGGKGKVVADATTPRILNEFESRSFWISWDKRTINVGEGNRKGQDILMTWKVPPSKHHGVNCLAVSTGPGSEGQWDFIEILPKEKPEDQTKSARRAKMKTSLLWLAKKQKMLQILEDAYPNSLDTGELLRLCNIKLTDMMTAVVFLKELQNRELITEVCKGIWMRAPYSKTDLSHDVKMVENIPILPTRDSPTIAIVTALYCEKLAVDAMMDRKTSYVRYKKEGESNVYTLGRIGNHQCVSTKLSRVGAGRGAAIAAGNSVTRLLGTFNRVEHVLLVGVGGSVPQYLDFLKHPRLGDVVVSIPCPAKSGDALYVHCEKLESRGDNRFNFVTRTWSSKDDTIQKSIQQLRTMHDGDSRFGRPWQRNVENALEILQSEESNFHRPAIRTDKLYALIDNKLMQVEHPKPGRGEERLAKEGETNIHYGPFGSGRYVARNDKLRMDFHMKTGVVAYDNEFDAVLDAIDGSRKDSFCIIRGIADYYDGWKKKEWQPYAAVAAAAYMKALIYAMPLQRRGSGYY